MMVNKVDPDEMVPLVEATRLFNRTRPPHFNTLYRWAHVGCLASDGVRVRLRLHRVGKRFYITPRDVEAFLSALAAADARVYGGAAELPHAEGIVTPTPPRARYRAREVAAADASLTAKLKTS